MPKVRHRGPEARQYGSVHFCSFGGYIFLFDVKEELGMFSVCMPTYYEFANVCMICKIFDVESLDNVVVFIFCDDPNSFRNKLVSCSR